MSRAAALAPPLGGGDARGTRTGVLYVSPGYATVTHLCCCGCGAEVVTPLSPTDWKLTFDGVAISLSPSVGNWSLPCRSHYFIDRIACVGPELGPRRRLSAVASGTVGSKRRNFCLRHLSRLFRRPGRSARIANRGSDPAGMARATGPLGP
jgi:hypothetical protein